MYKVFKRSKDIPKSSIARSKDCRFRDEVIFPCFSHQLYWAYLLLSRGRKNPTSSTVQKPCWRLQWQQERSEGPGICVLLWWSLINSVSCPSTAEHLCFPFGLLSLSLDRCFYLCKPKAAYFKGLSRRPSRCKAQQLDVNAAWHHNHLGPFFFLP